MSTDAATITPEQGDALLEAETARAPVPPPETIVAPPAPEVPAPIQAVGEEQQSHEVHLTDKQAAKLADKPFALQKASEKKLAIFLHQHLSPILSNGLAVDVQSNLDSWPNGNAPAMMDLHIDLMGDGVHKHAEELWKRATEELQKHPAFEGLNIGGGYETTGHNGETVSKEILENTNKLHMVISGIPVNRFKQLLETLAEVKPAPAHAEAAHADHACSGANCSHCNAQGAEAAVEAAPDSAALVAPLEAPATHPAADAASQAQANAANAVAGTAPAAQVAGVNHHGMTNDNSMMPTKTVMGL